MIEGVVNADYEAVLPLSIAGPTGETRDVEAVIDTGFNGFLTVTPALVAELGLPFQGFNRATLADGRVTRLNIHRVTVHWDGRARAIDAYVAETTPLAGMRLLEWHTLLVQVRGGGRVAVEAGA